MHVRQGTKTYVRLVAKVDNDTYVCAKSLTKLRKIGVYQYNNSSPLPQSLFRIVLEYVGFRLL